MAGPGHKLIVHFMRHAAVSPEGLYQLSATYAFLLMNSLTLFRLYTRLVMRLTPKSEILVSLPKENSSVMIFMMHSKTKQNTPIIFSPRQ